MKNILSMNLVLTLLGGGGDNEVERQLALLHSCRTLSSHPEGPEMTISRVLAGDNEIGIGSHISILLEARAIIIPYA